MNSMLNKLTQFNFELREDRSAALRVAGFLSISTFLTLFLFEPFGEVMHGYSLRGMTRILSYALVTGAAYVAMEFLLLPRFLSLKLAQTRHANLLWYALVLLVIISLIYLCKNLWMGFTAFGLPDYLIMIYRVSVVGFAPALILMALSYRKRAPDGESMILFSSTEVNPEQLRLRAEQVVAIVSEENYVSVIYRDRLNPSEIHSKLLRCSLSGIASQLALPFLRTHRSSIVNLTHVESYSGNSQGLCLHIPALPTPLRVSRSYIESFTAAWQELSQYPS